MRNLCLSAAWAKLEAAGVRDIEQVRGVNSLPPPSAAFQNRFILPSLM